MSKNLIFIPKVVLAIIILVVTTSGSKPYIASAEGQSIDPNTMLVGPNLLLDPSFEASYGSNQYWTQALGDTICIWWGAGCDVNGAGYHSGGSWGCFGCLGSNFDDIFQDVIFPRCGADLEFYLYIGEYHDPSQGWGMNNYFIASIDNIEVFRAYGSEVNLYQPYQKITIPVDGFADGAIHRVRFHSENLENFLWFNLDDVSLVEFNAGCTPVNVSTASTNRGTYMLLDGASTRQSYSNVDSGPLKVVSTFSVPIIASMRVAYNNGSAWTDFSEMMGLPIASLSTKYSFPVYDNLHFNSQLRFANMGALSTTVTVKVGTILNETYLLSPNQSQRISYAGLNGGPVVIQSSGNVPIIASLRVAYFNSTISKWTSFSEMMGLPDSQLSTSYLFPWYNNKDLNSQVRFGNVGNSPTNVTVTIGGVVKGTYNLLKNASLRFPLNTNDAPYANLDSGPVKVTSSGGVPIVASIRVAYSPNGGTTWTSFSELMGLPSNRLTNSYVFPWYNNLDLNSQLRFGNVGTSNTTVTVTVGGVFKGSYQLIPNESKRISYVGLDDGPVKVTSSGNIPIIASLRVAYSPNGGTTWTSFSELMGLPANQLSTSYLFPWYNNKDLNSQVRFGNP